MLDMPRLIAAVACVAVFAAAATTPAKAGGDFVRQIEVLGANFNYALVGTPYMDWSRNGRTFVACITSDALGARVYTLSNKTWVPQGPHLTASGLLYSGPGSGGCAVAISADSSTVAVARLAHNDSSGAVWVYTLVNGTWEEQASTLEPDGGVLPGAEVASQITLSGNGDVMAFSAPGYGLKPPGTNDYQGTVWVFRRVAGSWSQDGPALRLPLSNGDLVFGSAIDLDGPGETLAIGARGVDNVIGATYVFVRNRLGWMQHVKLVGSMVMNPGVSPGPKCQGNSVSLSGQFLAVGSAPDCLGTGSYGAPVWIFKRSSGVWSQDGAPLLSNHPERADARTYVKLSPRGDQVAIHGIDNDFAKFNSIFMFRRTVNASGNAVWKQFHKIAIP